MQAPKVVFIGNARSGKTTAVRSLLGEAPRNYIPTLGVEVYPYTAPNGATYNIWDCAGDARYGGLRSGYYREANVALIFSGGAEASNEEACGNRSPEEWEAEVKQAAPGVRVIRARGGIPLML